MGAKTKLEDLTKADLIDLLKEEKALLTKEKAYSKELRNEIASLKKSPKSVKSMHM